MYIHTYTHTFIYHTNYINFDIFKNKPALYHYLHVQLVITKDITIYIGVD